LNLDGKLVSSTDAGTDSAFTATFSDGFAEATDVRTATTKHAHSQQNPGKDWGLNTLQSIEFAFYALNQTYPETSLNPDNTTVIAASWSNGGRAVLMAAEQDTANLIDGVIAVEPSAAMDEQDFTITQGSRSWGPESVGWSLYDTHAFGAVYQPCANNLTANDSADLVNSHKSPERCTRLQALGLLESDSDDLQILAQEAQNLMNTTAGFLPEQNLAIPAFSSVFSEITNTYGNSYGRYQISDQLCGISFASYNGGTKQFESLSEEDKALRFLGQNMVAGGSRWVQPVNMNADSPYAATAFNSTDDKNLDGDLCFFAMSNYGNEKLKALGLLETYQQNGDFDRVQAGIQEAIMTGDLQDKPTIIMQGRSDQIIAPNHGARAYYARNRQVDIRDDVVYWEIENGHHLEMFAYLLAPNLGFYATPADMKHRYGYIHPYFEQAVNQMFAHLSQGESLSPSQVIRTTSMLESGEAQITEQMFGEIQGQPGEDQIVWSENTLSIPD
jgi:hydroxybutyrate-dimer hydrolase